MAKLSAHGTEIGTVEGIATAKRYMSDGKVLRNTGAGWKLYSKVKPGVTPEQAFEKSKQRLSDFIDARPCWAKYRIAMHQTCGLSKRWKLHAAISLMPDDPDGVWSEACDGYGDNIHADVDEVAELCMLYRNMVAEMDELTKLATAE